MGHCDSSTQLGREREVFFAGRGAASIAPSHNEGVARRFPVWLLLFAVRAYQVILGPFLGGACKFYPSCSHYAYEAIARHGARRGLWLAVKRLGRCRPFARGGFDPVPDIEENS